MRKYITGTQGMTLIEIMVVVAIIGLIMGVVTVNVLDKLDEAKVSTTKTQMKSLGNALDQYRRDAGYYPSTEQGLQALVEKPSSGRVPRNYPAKGYIKKIPRDPFDCEFIYTSPGTHGNDYEITSLGRDCAEGGEDMDADIHSYEIE